MIATIDLRPRLLHFVYQPGCDACAASEPAFDEFVKQRPLVMALRLNVNGRHDFPVKIRATPTWIYRVGDQATVREGALSIDELIEWIDAVEEALAR